MNLSIKQFFPYIITDLHNKIDKEDRQALLKEKRLKYHQHSHEIERDLQAGIIGGSDAPEDAYVSSALNEHILSSTLLY